MRLLTIVVAAALAAGCSSAQQEGAGRGAAMGAVGGAVAGAVSSMIFGGNVVQGAVAGGVTGAAAGAATGAMAGSMADKEAEARAAKAAGPDPRLAEVRKRIGDRNYATALLLAQCRHQDAIASAADTSASTKDPMERQYALLIESIAAEEAGDKQAAAAAYAKIGGSADKARADALEGVIKVQGARRQHGVAPTCEGRK